MSDYLRWTSDFLNEFCERMEIGYETEAAGNDSRADKAG